MKITNGATIFILLLLLLIPSVISDGGFIIYDEDLWGMADEEQQLAAINYQNGFQNMILTVETSEELYGDKVVWIFPVPSPPEKTVINIVKNFPTPFGYDIEERVKDTISETFYLIRATQIYPFPFEFFPRTFFMGAGEMAPGVIVYGTVEKYGLTTELISTASSQSFEDYLKDKDLEVPQNFKLILDEYIGQQYSFVISWISNVEAYKKEQPVSYLLNLLSQNKLSEAREFWRGVSDTEIKQKWVYDFITERLNSEYMSTEEIYMTLIFEGIGKGNKLGVFIGFPTEKVYYPLKPTSVYESKIIPVVIYIMDYAEPELYNGIQSNTEVNYFLQEGYNVPEELRDFFFGQEFIPDLKYTKIKISSPSKLLTQDLMMTISTPAKIKVIDFIQKNSLWWGLVVFIILSCLASLISGLIIFRKDSPSILKFTLFGLFNFLTLLGVIIFSYILKIDTRFTKTRRPKKNITIKFIILFILMFILLTIIFQLILTAII